MTAESWGRKPTAAWNLRQAELVGEEGSLSSSLMNIVEVVSLTWSTQTPKFQTRST